MFANEGAFDGTFCRFKNFFFFTRFFALFFNKNSWDISSLYFVEST
tara:strand:- start:2532 stop:2669 length:138 start_codon:yes stop_codon:yes gene_type:complete